MKTERGKGTAEEKAGARRGCFVELKEQSHLHNIKVQDETESAGVEAAVNYPEGETKIITEGGYTKQYIFNVDETAL